MKIFDLVRKLSNTLADIRSNWRTHSKQLLLGVLQSIMVFMVTFIISMVVLSVITPEYPNHHTDPIFRLEKEGLVGYLLRQGSISIICSEEYNNTNANFPIK